MRIAYIIDSMAFKGGAERIISEKMNELSADDSYCIYIITCYQFPDDTPNTYYISEKVKQIHLQIPVHLQYKYHYPRRLWEKWKYQHLLRKKLSKTINSIQPNIIVGVGYALADVVCNIRCQAKKVIESHEARHFTMSNDLYRERSQLSKMFVAIYRMAYLHTIEKKASVVVCLTREDASNWHKARRVEVIPNFSTMQVTSKSSGTSKRVIAVGRLEWQKGYDKLIHIWKNVSTKYPDWQLDIFGEGTLKKELQEQIRQEQVSNIAIHPFTDNISKEYASSSICVLTSRFEGFSLVLLEAMKHGVPCVTFDCPYGPRDVVDNKKSGYVVENDNIELFIHKLSELMDHPETRKVFSEAAIVKAKMFDKENIMKQWKGLFESLVKDSSNSQC